MKRILMFATVIWMGVIWSFSANPADASTETSHMAGKIISGLFVPGFQEWTEEKQMDLIVKIDHPVRKAAHAAEYAVLGVLLISLSGYYIKRRWILTAWTIGTLYAASDELHQYFVPGRSCQITDVMLDSAGVLAGTVFGWLFLRFLCARAKVRHGK